MLPLDVLENCKELFRNLREPPIGAQLRHELGLPRHVGGTLADMAADHLQFGFLSSHALSRRIQGNDQRRLVPGERRIQPYLTKPKVR